MSLGASVVTHIKIDFPKLLSNHPSPGEFRKFVPDWPTNSAYKETCCAQVSHAFNASSEPIEKYEYPDRWSSSGKARAFYSKRNQAHYLLAVHDFHAYLLGRYGEPEAFNNKGALLEATQSRDGILAFGHRHIDLWTEGKIHFQSIYNMAYLWDKSHWSGQKLMFWEVGAFTYGSSIDSRSEFDSHLGEATLF